MGSQGDLGGVQGTYSVSNELTGGSRESDCEGSGSFFYSKEFGGSQIVQKISRGVSRVSSK